MFLFALAPASGFGTTKILSDTTEIKLQPVQTLVQFTNNFPQQKVYLQTDKQHYLAGEAIWIKAYLVSASTHVPDTQTTNIYVEFFNTDNELIDFLILPVENGFSNGSIQISDSIPSGNYQIKAYTNWMANFGEQFMFKKDIFIHTPNEENFISRPTVRRNRRFNTTLTEKQTQMQFGIFPEGGQMVSGIENRVAFKAANAQGKGVDAKGSVYDRGGNKVAQFETVHQGKGMFSFTPSAGETYLAQVNFNDGQSMQVALPEIQPHGYLLRVETDPEKIHLTVRANFDPQQFDLPENILLVGHSRGDIRYVEGATLNDGIFQASIQASTFPDGIAHFTLFGPFNKPVAERLVFIRHVGEENFETAPTVEKEFGNGYITLNFHLGQQEGILPDYSSYALSVSELSGQGPFSQMNIATYLLLTSDIGSTIHDPWFYFADSSPDRLKALDLVMMTHGWRRFAWKDILAGEFPEIRFANARGLTLVGQVTPISSARETGELPVEISVGVEEQRQLLSTRTDRQGYFMFSGLDFTGTYNALISVGRDRRGRVFDISLFDRFRQSTGYFPNAYTQIHQVTERGPNWQQPDRANIFRRLFGNDAPPRRPAHDRVSLFGTPDQKIYIDDLDVIYTSVFDILRDRVVGLNVIGGQIVLRGVTSFMLSSEPVFFVDEVQVGRSSFLGIPVSEVERIEVLRAGASTAILGTRGGNGALLIYTRREMHQRQYSYEFQLRGYHAPIEFFKSQIQTEDYLRYTTPQTLFWAPDLAPDSEGNIRLVIPDSRPRQNLRFRLEGINSNGQITFFEF
ncbi:MAG TPA: TonB-dependent receptor plug domain-containing protein [Bacteroidales bacterium]|nr:TonB-dependent receptor plug domain-containing protein [Bacteroidales bacterium]